MRSRIRFFTFTDTEKRRRDSTTHLVNADGWVAAVKRRRRGCSRICRLRSLDKTFTIPLPAPDTSVPATHYRCARSMTRKPARALQATVILILLTTPTFAAEKAVPLTTFARLPVKEITVFKDGHDVRRA